MMEREDATAATSATSQAEDARHTTPDASSLQAHDSDGSFFEQPESRRCFLTQVGGAGVGLAAAQLLASNGTIDAAITPSAAAETSVAENATQASLQTLRVRLRVNGAERALQIEPRVTLLDALRERLDLTGTKKGCDHGQCGSCTVLLDGRRVNACLTLAVMCDGQAVTTIEGLAKGDELHPMQAAFIKHDGFQCGYCTPGQICSAVGLLAENHARTDADIREQMSGNICRCGAYPNIVAAIQEVRATQEAQTQKT